MFSSPPIDLIAGSMGGELNMVQASEEDIPNYWRLAREFVLSDNFFSSLPRPSFPNHLYTIAAQSGGSQGNPHTSPGSPDAPPVSPCLSSLSFPLPATPRPLLSATTPPP